MLKGTFSWADLSSDSEEENNTSSYMSYASVTSSSDNNLKLPNLPIDDKNTNIINEYAKKIEEHNKKINIIKPDIKPDKIEKEWKVVNYKSNRKNKSNQNIETTKSIVKETNTTNTTKSIVKETKTVKTTKTVKLTKENKIKKCHTCNPRKHAKEHKIKTMNDIGFYHDMCNRNIILVIPKHHFYDLYEQSDEFIGTLVKTIKLFCQNWNIDKYTVSYDYNKNKSYHHFNAKIRLDEELIKQIRYNHFKFKSLEKQYQS